MSAEDSDDPRIREVMTPVTVRARADDDPSSISKRMRDEGVGYVLVENEGRLCGVLTDRDLAVRSGVAGRRSNATRAIDICTDTVVTIDHDDPLHRAAELMIEHAVGRLAVTQNGRAVGVIAIGDLALTVDRDSACATICAASSKD